MTQFTHPSYRTVGSQTAIRYLWRSRLQPPAFSCEHRFPPNCIEGPCVLLWRKTENARKTYTHPHVLSLPTDSDAHSLVQPCVPDQAPPRSQLIQCDNDPYRFAPDLSYKFSSLLVGRVGPSEHHRAYGSVHGGSIDCAITLRATTGNQAIGISMGEPYVEISNLDLNGR
jgi:hypothetical protein